MQVIPAKALPREGVGQESTDLCENAAASCLLSRFSGRRQLQIHMLHVLEVAQHGRSGRLRVVRLQRGHDLSMVLECG